MSTIYIPANGPTDWRQFLAEPDRQWKDGYSARELTTCWQNTDGFPLNIKKIFNQSDIALFNNIEFLLAIPEQGAITGGRKLRPPIKGIT